MIRFKKFLRQQLPWSYQVFAGPKKQRQKGIAIILAVFCVTLIMYIVNEVTYESNVEYMIHAQAIQRVKAYYAARSGIEMSLLRIKIFNQVKKQLGQNAKGKAGQMLNMIWSFPLSWPPILPEGTNSVEKENVADKVKLALTDVSFTTNISDEGSKIDLNDLASPSKSIQEATKKQISQIFQNKIEEDKDWAEKNRDLNVQKLVNNITDWIDADTSSLNGGDERAAYEKAPANISTYPPNRAFRTIDEVRLVAGMKEDYFALLSGRITVYGAKAINVNTATIDVLTSLDKGLTTEIANEVIKRRSTPAEGGQFADSTEFWNFVESKGARIDPNVKTSLPLIFDAVINFRIRSTGSSGTAIREIEAVVYDIEQSAQVVAKKYSEDNKNNSNSTGSGTSGTASAATSNSNPTGPGNTSSSTNSAQNSSKGPPRIVYWVER